MAAASIASTGIVLEALRKDNYENWSALVENYLVGRGLWHGIVVAHPNKPHSDEKDDPKMQRLYMPFNSHVDLRTSPT